MKRTLLFIVSVLCLFSGCTRMQESASGLRTIGATMPEMKGTKVAVAQEEQALGLYWEQGDQLRVCGSSSQLYTLVSGAGEKSALFSGPSVSGNSFAVFYPGKYADREALMARSYEGQLQTGNASLSHLEYNVLRDDVTDLDHIDFSGAQRSNAFRFLLELPSDVTTVTRVCLSCTSPVFSRTNQAGSRQNTLSLALSGVDVSASSQRLTAYMMTSMQDICCSADDVFTVDVYLSDGGYYEKTFVPGPVTLGGGHCYTISLKSEGWTKCLEDGSPDHPYVIRNLADLLAMESRLVDGALTCFRLAADLDLSSVENWTPICAQSNNYGIDFDGGGHTLRHLHCANAGQYTGLFGFLVGNVRHLRFDAPVLTVDNSGSNIGVVAGSLEKKSACQSAEIKDIRVTSGDIRHTYDGYRAYAGGILGTVSVPATISGCRFEGSIVSTSTYDNASYPAYLGGIAGWAWSDHVSIMDCQVAGTISGPAGGPCGGIVAYLNKTASSVERCAVTASVTGRKDHCGGIVGKTNTLTADAIVIRNCFTTGDVTTATSGFIGGIAGSIGTGTGVECCYASGAVSGKYQAIGGIVGAASNHAKSASAASFSNTVSSCIAWNPSVLSLYPYEYKPSTNSQHISSGAVVGYGGDKNVYAGCYRRSDMTYQICTTPASWKDSLLLFDQEDASSASPLSQSGTASDGTVVDGNTLGTTFHPYHGKAAAAAITVSALARQLGWDASVWDLSGDFPVLRP